MSVHKIFVAVVDHTDRGQLFDAWYDGERIVKRSTQPFFDGCRVLDRRGLTGPAEMWGKQDFARMRGDIQEMAKLTVEERDRGGLRVGRWKPFPVASSRLAGVTVDGNLKVDG